MKKKLKVGVVFGGRSGEHEVSLVSARSVISALNRKKYQVTLIGITKNGEWITGQATKELLKGNLFKNTKIVHPVRDSKNKKIVIPRQSISNGVQDFPFRILKKLDVVFPILHGSYGEDGTIQGLFEMADVPYAGAGVLGSAIGMDKVVQKQLFREAKLPIVKFLYFLKSQFNIVHIVHRVEEGIGYPCFIKPANLGSSVGISKVHNKKELLAAIKLAFRYDRKIIIEQGIDRAREIEVSVLGNEKPKVSLPGEIIPSGEFYDYDAKYIDGCSKAVIPAKLSKKTIQQIRQLAIRAYRTINCSGMARVDFLLKGDKIYLNELNTIPGFTSISMYPKLWEASRLPYPKLLDKLISLALERHRKKSKFSTSYKPSKKWHKASL